MSIHKFLIHRNDVRYPNDAITFFNDKPEIGMIAKFRDVLSFAKEFKYNVIEIMQARRHLMYKINADVPYPASLIIHALHQSEENMADQWNTCYPDQKDLLLKVEQSMLAKYPEMQSVTRWFNTHKVIFPHNICVISVPFFEMYVNWLESVLEISDIPKKDKMSDLIAERLWTIWCIYQQNKGARLISANTKCYDKETGKVISTTDGL